MANLIEFPVQRGIVGLLALGQTRLRLPETTAHLAKIGAEGGWVIFFVAMCIPLAPASYQREQ